MEDFDSSEIDDIVNEISKKIFKGKEKIAIDDKLIKSIAKQYTKGFEKGFGVEFNKIDLDKINDIKRNIYYFSSAKSINQLKEMNKLLIDHQGKMRTFSEFKKEVDKLNIIYNKNYLKTEYNLVYASSTETKKLYDLTDGGKNMSVLLRWKTVMDGRTRHAIFNNITRKASDEFWINHPQPLQYNCRCTKIKVLEGRGNETVVPSGLPKGNPGLSNPFYTGQIYTEKHPYFTKLNAKEKESAKKVVEKILKEEKPVSPGGFQPAKTPTEATERLKLFTEKNVDNNSAFRQEVNFRGVHIDEMNMILKGVEDTLGSTTKVNGLGLHGKQNALGTYTRSLGGNRIPGQIFNSDKIELQRKLVKDPIAVQKSTQESFARSKDYRIKNLQVKIENSEGWLKTMYERELENLKKTKRWGIYQEDSVDPIYSTVVHECAHAVYYRNNLGPTFRKYLDQFDVDNSMWVEVSEYAGSKIEELWSESVAAIQCNIEIPKEIKKAVEETLKTVGQKPK